MRRAALGHGFRFFTLATAVATAGVEIAACSNTPKADAGLELIVATDGLEARTDFDHIRLEISQQVGSGWSKLWDNEYLVPSAEATLPAAFTLLSGSNAREVLILVTAFQGPQPIVQRVAQVQVPTDRLADLWLILAKICTGKVTLSGAEGDPLSTCQSGESCQPTGPKAGQCASNIVQTASLPSYASGQDFDAWQGAFDGSEPTVAEAGSTIEVGDSTDASRAAMDASREPMDAAMRGESFDAAIEDVNAVDSTVTMEPVDAAVDATSPSRAPDSGVLGSTAGKMDAASLSDVGPGSPECSAGDRQCSGNTPQTCVSGHWQSGTTCSGAAAFCNNGNCGVCQDGSKQCSFNSVQTCAAGAWGSAVACPATTPTCSAGTCGQPLSCQVSGAGTTQCGSSSESCCTSPEVPGGTFNRTYSNNGTGPTDAGDPATISGYRLDKYDVTVGRFRQFVTAFQGGWTPAASSGKHAHLNGGSGLSNSGSAGTFEPGWIATDNGNLDPTTSNLSCSAYASWTASAASDETLAIGCANWYEAYAFCIWDGGFLPSEAEWEFAAAGGNQQREYPWGSIAPGTANQYAIYGCNYPNGSGSCTGLMNVAPVGAATMGVGVWGQLDLAGTTWQFSLDWQAPFVDPCSDCGNFTTGSSRVIRGGTFDGTITTLTPSFGGYDDPTNRYGDIGFRCARSP